jgi:hypothetical protein
VERKKNDKVKETNKQRVERKRQTIGTNKHKKTGINRAIETKGIKRK